MGVLEALGEHLVAEVATFQEVEEIDGLLLETGQEENAPGWTPVTTEDSWIGSILWSLLFEKVDCLD